MASAASPLPKFIIYAPDKTGVDTFQKRLAVRNEHLERAAPKINEGVFKVAGALLTPESVESPSAEKKMIGSVIIVEAKNMEEVREMAENDIYYTSGVWDPEQLVILPFQPAMPFP